MSRLSVAATAGLLTGLFGLIASIAPFGLDLEEAVGLDLLFKLRGIREGPSDVLIVAIDKASADKMSSCAIIDVPARLQAEKEAVLWWMMIRGSQYLGPGSTLSWVAWLGFLLNGALGAWAYARLCAQLADFARGKQ